VVGKSGYKLTLTEENWRALGSALRRLHTLNVPPTLLRNVRREVFDASGRDKVKAFLSRLEPTAFRDATARETAAFMQASRADLLELVRHAERFARTLPGRALERVVCHADLHAENLLLDGTDFYIVDWDDPILAPKERDLMFIGGGQACRLHARGRGTAVL
jgi:spectinomycin phosphotransferase